MQGNDEGPGLLLVLREVMDGIILVIIVVKIHRLGLGLVGPASPGSIIAYFGVAARGDFPLILVGILLSALVSFVVSSLLMGFGRKENREAAAEDAEAQQQALADAQAATAANKATSKGTAAPTAS